MGFDSLNRRCRERQSIKTAFNARLPSDSLAAIQEPLPIKPCTFQTEKITTLLHCEKSCRKPYHFLSYVAEINVKPTTNNQAAAPSFYTVGEILLIHGQHRYNSGSLKLMVCKIRSKQ